MMRKGVRYNDNMNVFVKIDDKYNMERGSRDCLTQT